MYHIHTTRALILRTIPVGEANLVVLALTRDLGLITARVQSARVTSSKLRHALVEHSIVLLSCIHAKNGWKITSAVPEKNFFFGARHYTQKIFAQITTLLLKLIVGEEPQPVIFDIVETGFEALEKLPEDVARDCECVCVLRILYELGYVGDIGKNNMMTQSCEWGSDVLAEARAKRLDFIGLINTGLSASSLTK